MYMFAEIDCIALAKAILSFVTTVFQYHKCTYVKCKYSKTNKHQLIFLISCSFREVGVPACLRQ